MPKIMLPDGSEKMFEGPVSGVEIAASIGPGLAKAALAMEIDGQQRDLTNTIERDAQIRFLTAKDSAGLEILRHSTAHLLAYAVKELFPEVQVTIGPVIENGFYYDFSFERPFTPDDLASIEQRMQALAKRDIPVSREVWPRDKAVAFFKSIGEHYKAEIIASIPAGEAVSLYSEGEFIDLCRGPHVPSTGKLKAFKLMSVAGAYWRGDSNNEMLQRIYGTAWANKDDLKAYLHQLEEAEKRDHRRLAKQLNLFHMQEEAPGMVFWHPKGWTIWQQTEQYLRHELTLAGYQEIKTPQIADRSLWERSGHWENYREHMFTTESEKRDYAIKPMNCPCHVQIYNHRLRSYRDLPLRLAEFGSCHRNEHSGALHGLMRVRGFVQDDAHIFCTEDQIIAEVIAFNALLAKIYAAFGFHEIGVKLALRPDQRAGSDDVWDRAEQGLRESLRASGLEWEELPNEGAFYGPKIEYHIKDAIGRSWQCGTMQLDFVLPERLSAEYVAEDNTRQRPVMLHRAILGSMERFIGILIESYAGDMPLWLAPIQAVVMGITNHQDDAVQQLVTKLSAHGIRAEADIRSEKVQHKIREHSLQKIPLLLVLGQREVDNGTVTVRRFGSNAQTTLAVPQLIDDMLLEISNKHRPTTATETEAA